MVHFILFCIIKNRFISLYLAAEFRSIFSEFPYFNRVQSTVYDDVNKNHFPLFFNLWFKFLIFIAKIIYTNKNVVISAPTSSGKTVIMVKINLNPKLLN